MFNVKNVEAPKSGRQLLSISWNGLYNLGAGLSASGIKDSDHIACF
jgi:hypothetical protein